METVHQVAAGEAWSLLVQLLLDGAAQSIAGVDVVFEVTATAGEDEPVVISRTLADGIIAYDATSWLVQGESVHTTGLFGKYHYRIRATIEPGRPKITERGAFEILKP